MLQVDHVTFLFTLCARNILIISIRLSMCLSLSLSLSLALSSAFELPDEHTKGVSVVRWSPSGAYLASAAADGAGADAIEGRIVVWDVVAKDVVTTMKTLSHVCALTWSPSDNVLSFILQFGWLHR
jgi:WD40 repeat protein